MKKRPPARYLGGVLLGVAGWLMACGGARPAAPAKSATRPNVLIVELDACRADKVSAYGFDRPTTPALDALAADPDGVLYEWELVQAPHTKASTASLFSGVYVFQHGVFTRDDLTKVLATGGHYGGRTLAEAYPTLAETFKSGGYRTYAHPRIGHLTAKAGFAQGFDEYLDPARHRNQWREEAYVDAVVKFLSASTQPGFAYIHVIGCHNAFPPIKRDPDYMRRYGAGFDQEALAARGIDPGKRAFKWAIRTGRLKLDPEAVRFVHTVYESVLNRVDRVVVARAVDALRRAGLYDRTLLVVSADHGEELYDHGSYAHGHAVWNEVIHVPLIVKFPRGGRPAGLPHRVSRVTQSIDLYPGLVGYAGIRAPDGIAGHDLFDPAARPEIALSEAPGSWALVEFPLKAIVYTEKHRAALYDLTADPHELHDLAAARPDDLRRLVHLGEGMMKVMPRVGASQPMTDQKLDAETIRQLRSLGYIH